MHGQEINKWKGSTIQYIQYDLNGGERTKQEVPRQIENCIIVTIRLFGRNFF